MTKLSPQRRLTLGVLSNFQMYDGTLSSYLQPIIRGIKIAAHNLDCNLLLACGVTRHSGPGPSILHPAWPTLSPDSDFLPVGPWNTDGLLVCPPFRSAAREAYIQELIDSGFPVVFVGHDQGGLVVAPDNVGGIRQAMAHLVEHGHRKIAFLGGWENMQAGDVRLQQYKILMKEYGLSVNPRLIAYGEYNTPGAFRAMQQILSTGEAFTAVLACNDESAIGAMQALRLAGRRVPQDVALIGFDNRMEAAVQLPPLTTIHFSLHEIGYQSVQLMLDAINGRVNGTHIIHLPTTLVVRRSCGCKTNEWQAIPDADPGFEPSDDLAQTQVKLAQAMVSVLPADAQSLPTVELNLLCRMLLNAFLLNLERPAGLAFQAACLEVLYRVEENDMDIIPWESVISVLRRWMPDLLALTTTSDEKSHKLAEDILHQGRIAISESTQRRDYRHRLQQAAWAEREGILTARLLSAQSELQILAALKEHLPGLGIRQAQVFFYEADGDPSTSSGYHPSTGSGYHPSTGAGYDPVAWSRLSTDAAPGLRFPSRSFPPPGLAPENLSGQWALLPLIFQDDLLGFVAFETERLEVCAIVARQLAAAYKNVRLHQEAMEGRRLAEEANGLKSRFLATVSHELRTPLSFIVGMTDMMLRSPAPSAQADLEKIHTSAEHLNRLIRDVLDLASSEAGQLRIIPETVNLSKILQMVAETGAQLAEEKGIGWHSDLPAAGVWVWGDATRLRQVALNLVVNAIKFTAKGQVTLTLTASDNDVRVQVQDTGLGIPLTEQAVIFDEFRQSERTAGRGYRGLGLGLAICKRLVALHGGQIGVKSLGMEGSGSTFYFNLPRIAAPSTLTDVQTTNTVLFLTEHEQSVSNVQAYLTDQGFTVHTLQVDAWVKSMAKMVNMLLSAVVLDAPLAVARGWEILQILKRNPATQSIPVLFYSLESGSEVGTLLEVDSLTKPLAPDDLKQALTRQGLMEANLTTKTILVVDDEPNILELHLRLVQELATAHRVVQAKNGREALAILRETPVDLVLLDLMMPEVDGFTVLETMRTNPATRDVPVIVLTAQVLTEADMLRLNRGVTSVLSKGLFSVSETLAHLDAVLQRVPRPGMEAQRIVRKAMAYIQNHAAHPLTRSDIAEYVGVSESYLTHCFQDELHLPPMTYLTRYRINQAKALLAISTLSLADIAEQVGFSSEVYFHRVFRREVGVPPGAYRKGWRSPVPST